MTDPSPYRRPQKQGDGRGKHAGRSIPAGIETKDATAESDDRRRGPSLVLTRSGFLASPGRRGNPDSLDDMRIVVPSDE